MPAPPPALPGFRLRSFIGSGPFGQVYRAYDEHRGREVAVKMLDPRRCTPRGLARLAELAARAATSPVARADQLYEVVPDPARPFVVMDLLPGESLQQLLLRVGPMPWKKARAIAHAIAVALEAAHDVGVVHGAVKPTNIFFHGGLVLLTDFGIRTLAGPRDQKALLADAGRLAPEQARGEEPDARADVYGLGLVLYELVTGRLPFVGDPRDVLHQQRKKPPPAPSTFNPDLPAAADALILELLAKTPAQRPPTASRLR
ncbi:MAG TPA: serine/threonine-protein kinase, partial [Nannocystis sp.]